MQHKAWMVRPKLAVWFMSITMILTGTPQAAFAQACTYATWHQTGEMTDAQPGLAAFNDRLVLTWEGKGNGYLNSMVSWDGVNWYYKNTMWSWPTSAEGYAGGVGMTYSAPCGGVYMAWRDNSYNLWAAKSGDGVNWTGPYWLGQGLTAPALRGDDPSLGIGFAVSQPNPPTYEVFKGRVDCDLVSNYLYPKQPAFFNPSPNIGERGLEFQPTPVAWTGGAGVELSAVASGPGNQPPYDKITIQLNNNLIDILPNWSNNGIAGTVSPLDGNAWVAATCHKEPGTGDTCDDESREAKINVINAYWHGRVACPDWSIRNPAITFWQGLIWIAWRGGANDATDGKVHIAAIYPF